MVLARFNSFLTSLVSTLIHNMNRFYRSKELFESCEIFNLYKLNLLNTAVFMQKTKSRSALSSFLEKFDEPSHSYQTRLSNGNYRKPQIKLRKCRFRISISGPAIWNDLIGSMEKEIQSSSLFKTKIKSKLLNFENEVTFSEYPCFYKTHLEKHWPMVTTYYGYST